MPTLPTQPAIDFGRDLCCNLSVASTREWLVTNGIGGFASGTVSGIHTRRYHGLLMAALKPPLGRTLLVTKFDETAIYDGRVYEFGANQWASGVTAPTGFNHLERFYLDGTMPVWEYNCADAVLEKRVWMAQGENSTYIRYTLLRGMMSLHLQIKALVNYRDYHNSTHARDWRMQIEPAPGGLCVLAYDSAIPFYLLSEGAIATPQHEWYRDFAYSIEAYRGLDANEDHLFAGEFSATLQLGIAVTFVASTNPTPNLNGATALANQQSYQQQLLTKAETVWPAHALTPPVQQLILAADQFIVARTEPSLASTNPKSGHSVIAGYPWFGDWGRDTMIALPGLTLTTGRPEVAASILRTFARFVDQGMLPNRFPDAGEQPEYNTADATLWYFEALRAYYTATKDNTLLRELFPVLQEIINWHQRGTRYNIHVDPNDGLLYAGEAGVQLTWMDAKVGDWVVTPRQGKAVELNALWYNALRSMVDFARRLQKPYTVYNQLADQAQAGFGRFWHRELGYCCDVLDTPTGNDASLRPNQIFAVSLPHSPLPPEQQKAVVDVCTRYLLTPHGLRSLAPGHPDYKPHYGGAGFERDSAYHQGTVWAWPLGAFALAHLHVYQDRDQVRSYLVPLLRHLTDHGLGSLSEIFDAEPPFTPRGCYAQAWSVAEVLRAWHVTMAGRQGNRGISYPLGANRL